MEQRVLYHFWYEIWRRLFIIFRYLLTPCIHSSIHPSYLPLIHPPILTDPFLITLGDPVVCHACCVVRVCSVKDQLITVHQLSTVGRVATCAKKMIMWAAPDEKGKLLFILQEWTGPEKKAIPKYNIVTDCTEVLKSCKRVK